MRRYYLCDIIGTGDPDTDPFRPAVADHGVNYVVQYPPRDPATGQYTRPHCLVLVAAANHTALLKDRRVDALPDFPLDGKLTALRTETRGAMDGALSRRGITATWGASDALRDVVRGIGRQLAPEFDENNFDVSEA